MDKFTASNRYSVHRKNEQTLCVTNASDTTRHELGLYTVEALREFFRAERDEELGRWRWPENPDYVVYPTPTRSLRVVRENGYGDAWWVDRGDDRAHEYCHAARAYIEAHAEPKPWHDAKPGELWVLDLKGSILPAEVYRFTERQVFRPVADPHRVYLVHNDSLIEDARRIWPQD